MESLVRSVTAERDGAYRERAQLVAYLAACYPSEIWTDHDSPGWPVVAVETPAGQMSWHIAESDMDLFAHVTERTDEDRYDGHTTGQKYQRLAELTILTASARNVDTELRERIGAIRDGMENLAARLLMSAASTSPSKKSEIERACAAAVREVAEAVKL